MALNYFFQMSEFQIENAAKAACESLFPEKSKGRYERAYGAFKKWCQSKNTGVSEMSLLAYFMEKSATLKSPASLWCEYSMIKSSIFIEENTDISKYPKLRAFLKRKNDGYKPKKSSVFTREQVNDFLLQASDDTYLLMKVVAVLGIAGACRSDELCKLTMENVKHKNNNDIIIVTIPDSKNGMSRTFTITSCPGSVCHLEIVKKYITIRLEVKTDNSRFFMRYQSGRCCNQPVGKNTISTIPNKIAQFLNLENPKTYTGHSFRRTSATLLANTGVDVLAIKRHGGWKSATIAESYVADSLCNKNEVANRILHNKTSSAASSSTSHQVITMDQSDNIEPQVIVMEQSDHFEKNVVVNKREGSYPNFVNNVTNCNNCTITININ